MPVPVQNLVDGPTTFADVTKNIALEWQAKGHANGEDVQIVPDEIVETAQFQKAMQRNIFKVLDTEGAADAAFDLQTAAVAQKQADAAKLSVDVLDPAANNDLIQVPCIGPNDRGVSGACGNPVAVREKAKNEKPPLCSQHANLAAEFIPTETDTLVDGKPVVTWSRSGLAPREKQ